MLFQGLKFFHIFETYCVLPSEKNMNNKGNSVLFNSYLVQD
jgi:hypothetical protein